MITQKFPVKHKLESLMMVMIMYAALPGQEKVWRLLDNAKVGRIMSKTGEPVPCVSPIIS